MAVDSVQQRSACARAGSSICHGLKKTARIIKAFACEVFRRLNNFFAWLFGFTSSKVPVAKTKQTNNIVLARLKTKRETTIAHIEAPKEQIGSLSDLKNALIDSYLERHDIQSLVSTGLQYFDSLKIFKSFHSDILNSISKILIHAVTPSDYSWENVNIQLIKRCVPQEETDFLQKELDQEFRNMGPHKAISLFTPLLIDLFKKPSAETKNQITKALNQKKDKDLIIAAIITPGIRCCYRALFAHQITPHLTEKLSALLSPEKELFTHLLEDVKRMTELPIDQACRILTEVDFKDFLDKQVMGAFRNYIESTHTPSTETPYEMKQMAQQIQEYLLPSDPQFQETLFNTIKTPDHLTQILRTFAEHLNIPDFNEEQAKKKILAIFSGNSEGVYQAIQTTVASKIQEMLEKLVVIFTDKDKLTHLLGVSLLPKVQELLIKKIARHHFKDTITWDILFSEKCMEKLLTTLSKKMHLDNEPMIREVLAEEITETKAFIETYSIDKSSFIKCFEAKEKLENDEWEIKEQIKKLWNNDEAFRNAVLGNQPDLQPFVNKIRNTFNYLNDETKDKEVIDLAQEQITAVLEKELAIVRASIAKPTKESIGAFINQPVETDIYGEVIAKLIFNEGKVLKQSWIMWGASFFFNVDKRVASSLNSLVLDLLTPYRSDKNAHKTNTDLIVSAIASSCLPQEPSKEPENLDKEIEKTAELAALLIKNKRYSFNLKSNLSATLIGTVAKNILGNIVDVSTRAVHNKNLIGQLIQNALASLDAAHQKVKPINNGVQVI